MVAWAVWSWRRNERRVLSIHQLNATSSRLAFGRIQVGRHTRISRSRLCRIRTVRIRQGPERRHRPDEEPLAWQFPFFHQLTQQNPCQQFRRGLVQASALPRPIAEAAVLHGWFPHQRKLRPPRRVRSHTVSLWCESASPALRRAIHSNLDHVDGVKPLFPQALRGGRRETLIQQESTHATRSVDRRSSSAVAAA